jgi:hypothetical protein
MYQQSGVPMKKMIILIGLVFTFSATAGSIQRMTVTDMAPVEDMYASFEIVTPKYDKVILDCQSFINGMNFYKNKKIVHAIRMVDYDTCSNVYDFIDQSLKQKKAICMEIEEGSSSLNLSNDEASECQ